MLEFLEPYLLRSSLDCHLACDVLRGRCGRQLQLSMHEEEGEKERQQTKPGSIGSSPSIPTRLPQQPSTDLMQGRHPQKCLGQEDSVADTAPNDTACHSRVQEPPPTEDVNIYFTRPSSKGRSVRTSAFKDYELCSLGM